MNATKDQSSHINRHIEVREKNNNSAKIYLHLGFANALLQIETERGNKKFEA